MASLLALQHGTTVNTMAWCHSQHHGMVPLLTLHGMVEMLTTPWHGTTVNTIAWCHCQHHGMVPQLTVHGMVEMLALLL